MSMLIWESWSLCCGMTCHVASPLELNFDSSSVLGSTADWEESNKLQWSRERLGELLINMGSDAGSVKVTSLKSLEGEVRYVLFTSFAHWQLGVIMMQSVCPCTACGSVNDMLDYTYQCCHTPAGNDHTAKRQQKGECTTAIAGLSATAAI